MEMRFRDRDTGAVVKARELTSKTSIEGHSGHKQTGQVGDWVVDDGYRKRIWGAEIFSVQFLAEPVQSRT